MEDIKNDVEMEASKSNEQVCCNQLQQFKERYVYLTAEFDNYKKRSEKERAQWYEHAQDAIIVELLPIIDDMDRAVQELQAQSLSDQDKARFAGLELIAKEFVKMLKKAEVSEIAFENEFNPELFEAVMQVQADKASGSIVTILQKGYTRKGRVLRPAKVSVAQ